METLTKRLIGYLAGRGFTEQESPSRKYRKFLNPDKSATYWVGKAGAIRKGQSSSNSTSVTAAFKKFMERAGV